VNRNVMCTPLAERSAIHAAACDTARAISEHLTPNTSAYHEIWLDKERIAGGEDHEPIYGATYLPRKFKIGIAIPPSNDIDIYSQDLGFIAIQKDGELAGFNVTVGGGMGRDHRDPTTYPRLADVIGFCTPDQVVDVAEKVVLIQRDFGNRANRKYARLKYTINARSLDWFTSELYARLGYELPSALPFQFDFRGDELGWLRDQQGSWHLALFVPQGRLADDGESKMLSALKAVAEVHHGTFRLTANQNLIISGVADDRKVAIDRLLADHGVTPSDSLSPLRRLALACVALPTCGLAMAEAERYLPAVTDKIETLLAGHGLQDEPITFRITGCPNGCARPYLAEIALVGKAPGQYALYLGGSHDGKRLNRLAEENLDETEILKHLDRWFGYFASERDPGEPLGDFIDRKDLKLP